MTSLLSLIEAKRDGGELSAAQMREFARCAAQAEAPDYQIAALLMAIYLRGLSPRETRALTLATRDSGEVLRWPSEARPVADKHSTGGVGDKISLPLAPLLACLGLRVPMISGRGLGITGGTLDKLDSVPGFRARLSSEEIGAQVQELGCVICGQTERLAPADRALYALRDATATVPSLPLITASIMGKKLAEGLDALVLDVKFGRAAFMPDLESARELAQAMCEAGRACGVKTRALLSEMNAPLGRACGNWLEIAESEAVLRNSGPADVTHLTLELAAHLLELSDASSLEEGRARAQECLASGAPLQKWRAMLHAQGADLPRFEAMLRADQAPFVREVAAPRAGFVQQCDARLVGELVRDMGGGRMVKDDVLDFSVGVDRLAQRGEKLQQGALLGRVHARSEAEAAQSAARLLAAFEIGDSAPQLAPIVREVVE